MVIQPPLLLGQRRRLENPRPPYSLPTGVAFMKIEAGEIEESAPPHAKNAAVQFDPTGETPRATAPPAKR